MILQDTGVQTKARPLPCLSIIHIIMSHANKFMNNYVKNRFPSTTSKTEELHGDKSERHTSLKHFT